MNRSLWFSAALASLTALTVADAFAQASAPASAALPVAAAASARIDATVADCRPAYPPAALRAHVQGTSYLAFLVDATGKATKAGILESSGDRPEHKLLDQSALYWLAQCPFKPARDADGQPVEGIVKVHYTWRIE